MNAPTSLIPLVEADPSMVLTDAAKFATFLEHVRQESAKAGTDVSTPKARDAIKSAAYKIVRSKTAIDAAGKTLNESAREQINKVDAARREIREKLDALAAEVRQPLTDWEEAEEARAAECKQITDAIRRDSIVTLEDTAHTVAARLDHIKLVEITEAKFAEGFDMACLLQSNAIEAMTAAHIRLLREEDERAELVRLRAAEEERQRQVERDRIEAEQKAAEARDEEARKEAAARAESEAQERQAAERQRIADAAAAAERAATQAAERAAQEAREAQERAHAEALAAEKRRADEAEAARQAEADRVARAEAARVAEIKAQEAAQAAREADVAHKGKIMGAAKDALIALGLTEQKAKAVVMAIKAGEVPHVSIRF